MKLINAIKHNNDICTNIYKPETDKIIDLFKEINYECVIILNSGYSIIDVYISPDYITIKYK
jgi:hypothetical protein